MMLALCVTAASAYQLPSLKTNACAGNDGNDMRRRLIATSLLAACHLQPPAQALAFKLPDLMTGVAGPGGVQLFGPSGELGRLSEAREQLLKLASDLESGVYKGDEEDSIVVLKLSAIYFRSTPGLMELTTAAMDQLEATELTSAAQLTSAFDEAVKILEEGCRTRELARQKDGCAKASERLGQYLSLAALHYTVPEVRISR